MGATFLWHLRCVAFTRRWLSRFAPAHGCCIPHGALHSSASSVGSASGLAIGRSEGSADRSASSFFNIGAVHIMQQEVDVVRFSSQWSKKQTGLKVLKAPHVQDGRATLGATVVWHLRCVVFRRRWLSRFAPAHGCCIPHAALHSSASSVGSANGLAIGRQVAGRIVGVQFLVWRGVLIGVPELFST